MRDLTRGTFLFPPLSRQVLASHSYFDVTTIHPLPVTAAAAAGSRFTPCSLQGQSRPLTRLLAV